MASAHHPAQAPRYSLPSMPNAGNDFRLPSLKDLNFQYRPPGQGQEGPPLSTPGGSPQAEHVGSSQSHPGRHDPTSWGRPSPTTPVSASMPPQLPHQTQQHPHQHPHPPIHPHQHQHQHSPPLSVSHQQQSSRPVDYGVQRHDNGGYLTPGLPLSAQVAPLPGSVTIGPGSRGDDSHSSKRSRANPNMSVPRDNRSHVSYPIPQNPQYSPQQQTAFHPVQPGPGPPPHEQVQQQTGPGGYPHPQYGYPPQYMPPRAHNVQHLHPHHQQQPQGNPYLPPQQDSWEHQQQSQSQAPQHHHPQPAPHQPQQQPPPPPQQHQHYQPQTPQQMNFASTRTTALVPQSVDSRVPAYQTNQIESEQKMSEIIKHCTVLYTFANRYAQLQASLPRVQPTAQELAEMNQRAAEVVRLLNDYRRLAHPEFERRPTEPANASRTFEGNRPPKRPWEDMAQEDAVGNEGPYPDHPAVSDKAQTTAEQDMEIIRTKRATSAAGGPAATGQPKSKYRKRSRATPPGKCHSCNIRETPEWRRGPDGARTLCNACGLHYAKLMRKRDKQIAAEGQAPRIDMETLRASARAADLDKSHARSQVQASSSQTPQVPPLNAPTPPIDPNNQAHHQSSFQVVNMGSSSSAGPSAPATTSHSHQIIAPPDNTVAPAPPPSWAGPRVQSFMRTSQHSGSSDASPR